MSNTPELIIYDMSDEIWEKVTIPNIVKPNYEISNKGRVRNITTGKILKPWFNKQNGYLYVSLMTYILNAKTGKPIATKCTIHRLVHTHFTDEPDKIYDRNYIVNHKDGNKLHCEAYNLEWETYKGNANHALEHGLLHTCDSASNCLTTDDTVRKICELLQDGFSYKEICNKLSLPWNDYHKSLLVRIRRRVEWKEISKDYDFDSAPKLRQFDDSFVDKICMGIEKGYSTGTMYSLYGDLYPYQKFRKLVWNVRNRNTYRNISEKYSWWKVCSTTIDS